MDLPYDLYPSLSPSNLPVSSPTSLGAYSVLSDLLTSKDGETNLTAQELGDEFWQTCPSLNSPSFSIQSVWNDVNFTPVEETSAACSSSSSSLIAHTDSESDTSLELRDSAVSQSTAAASLSTTKKKKRSASNELDHCVKKGRTYKVYKALDLLNQMKYVSSWLEELPAKNGRIISGLCHADKIQTSLGSSSSRLSSYDVKLSFAKAMQSPARRAKTNDHKCCVLFSMDFYESPNIAIALPILVWQTWKQDRSYETNSRKFTKTHRVCTEANLYLRPSTQFKSIDSDAARTLNSFLFQVSGHTDFRACDVLNVKQAGMRVPSNANLLDVCLQNGGDANVELSICLPQHSELERFRIFVLTKVAEKVYTGNLAFDSKLPDKDGSVYQNSVKLTISAQHVLRDR